MPTIRQISVTSLEHQKLLDLKNLDEDYRERPMGEYVSNRILKGYLRSQSLTETVGQRISRSTQKGLGIIWFENFYANIALGHFGDVNVLMKHLDDQLKEHGEEYYRDNPEQSMPTLTNELRQSRSIANIPKRTDKPCIIVAAGPSIKKHNHIELLAKSEWKGPILATDRMLRPLLEAGVSPESGYDLMVAGVDGHRIVIPKWYQDEQGNPLNAEGVTGLLCSTTAPQAVIAAKTAGVDTYFFHGLFDDFFSNDSVCGAMEYMVKFPAISAGGNIGSTNWTLSLYLRCNPVIFIGFDLGYNMETPIEETAYYHKLNVGGATSAQINAMFNEGFNPDFGVGYRQDPVFKHYKDGFISMLEIQKRELNIGLPDAYPFTTINSTEGGSIHHPTLVKGMTLRQVLEEYGEK